MTEANKNNQAPTPPDELKDFLEQITVPREPINMPDEQAKTENQQELTNDDQANENFLDYDQEHKQTAIFIIGLIDQAFGFAGMAISGLEPAKYQKFAKSSPPAYYVDVTAALVKKYQAALSLEGMFISALLMVYAPVIPSAIADRKREQEKAQREQMEKEILRRNNIINGQ